MKILTQIFEIIAENANEKELAWLKTKIDNPNNLSIAFVAVPRFISKKLIDNQAFIGESIIENWTLDRLVRVYLLLLFEENSASIDFEKNLNTLFETAEINESVALYSALPFFQNPENWLLKATDAVRSNIGDVFDSLAFGNVYPSKYFPELAWNQLVLKCVFNEKSITQIIGLNQCFNQNLATIFIDFVHERWAAGRSVPPNTWQIVQPFLVENNWREIQGLFQSKSIGDNLAAYLLASNSRISTLNNLIDQYPISNSPIDLNALTWNYFESLR